MQYTEQLNNLFNHNIKYLIKYNYQPYFLSHTYNYTHYTDAFEYLKVLYIKDLWLTETQPSVNEGHTEELVIQYIETGILNNLTHTEADTVQNIHKTVSKYITYTTHTPIITLELIHNIHNDLMYNLLQQHQIGTYRTTYVKPHNSDMEYLNHKLIEKKLQILINFFNNTQTNTKNEYILKSIIFFSEFLRIHPYKDGNGRTARILFNYMIQHLIVCPISLCSSLSSRNIYIHSLEARSDSLVKYNNLQKLIDYIFDRIEKTYITFISVC
jgi:Fic family protein